MRAARLALCALLLATARLSRGRVATEGIPVAYNASALQALLDDGPDAVGVGADFALEAPLELTRDVRVEGATQARGVV